MQKQKKQRRRKAYLIVHPKGSTARKPMSKSAFTVGGAGNSPAGLADAMDALKEGALKRVEKTFENLAPMVEPKTKREYRVRQKTGTKTAGKVGRIPAPAGDDSSDKRIHIHFTHDVQVRNIVLGTDPLTVYKQKIETGVPSSKALKRLGKQNGTSTITLFDTKVNREGLTQQCYTRNQLTIGTGFEQKGLSVFDRNQIVTFRDIANLIDYTLSESQSQPYDLLQKAYASVLNTRVELMIRNQSAFQKANVVIHLCKHTKNLQYNPYWEDISDNVFYPDITTSPPDSTQTRTRIPLQYQFTSVRSETAPGADGPSGFTNISHSVDYDPSVNVLKYSPYFKEHFEIVKSEGHLLGPGDFYNFTHIHHFGPGFDVTRLYGQSGVEPYSNLDALPTSYFFLIEYVGLQTEVTYANPNDGEFEPHIGRGPVVLSLEMRKKLTFVNAEKNASDLSTSGILTGANNMHVRYFNKFNPLYKQLVAGTPLQMRKFNLPLDKWTSVATPPAGSFVIAQVTDRTTRTDTHASGNTNATDVLP